ncbi:carbon-nitrogen hydrolase family protein [Agarivorans gilvus]|uniref:Hydrolase n=1 Tax=Agarivorans gilvus TaxID=680279 RepID=A0ABQ1I2U8_9ALTE|nr:carbon-nitrogen hydrolase family protein [Agarivorans gilvus]GGB04797.1 hydrolase [Agarivorans gilvus]
MNKPLTISLAQLPVVKGDLSANLAIHLNAIAQAASQGADLVVFPELSLSGYELEMAEQLAVAAQADNFAALSAAAVQHKIMLIVGCPLRSKAGAKPMIGAVICFADGRVEFYAKQYLHPGEQQYCSPGHQDYLFSLKGRRIALAICADFAASEHSLRARQKGADIYLVSALISKAGFADDAKILAEIAAKQQFSVLLSNHISTTGGWATCGNNSIWNHAGELIGCSESSRPCLLFVTFTGEQPENRVEALLGINQDIVA